MPIAIGIMVASSCSEDGGIDYGLVTPPSTITDLAVVQVDSVSVTLRWTAPDLGSPTSRAAHYDLRFATTAIDPTNWSQAVEVADEPEPLPPGSIQTMVVTGLPFDTLVYFALRTSSRLWSEISNSASATLPPERVIAFADPALESVIREIVHKPDGPLHPSDLVAVQEVRAGILGIHNLDGLQYCVNLTFLDIPVNGLTSLAPLAGLTSLGYLNVSWNRISDLRPLAGLTYLSRLTARKNAITDLEPLAGLHLQFLELGENAISDLRPLQNMEFLRFLALDDNRITEITALAGCVHLDNIILNRNSIADLTPLTGLTELSRLMLISNAITDVGPLVDNTALDTGSEIWLKENPLSETARNMQIPALRARGVAVWVQ